MKTNSVNAWSPVLPELSLSTVTTRRNRRGVIKLVPPPTPPDEETIRRLNALAAENPFCALHKCKKHELL